MMNRKLMVLMSVVAGLALLAGPVEAKEKTSASKKAAMAKAGKKRSNKDLYLEGPPSGAQELPAETPSDFAPTVRFWAEKERDGGRDIVLDDQKTVYQSGDKVWFKFSANVPCYAYLVNKGSSGQLCMLYPGLAGRENKVTARQTKIMPSVGIPFTFDSTPGDEELCLVIAPERVEDLEQIAAGDEGKRSRPMGEAQKGLWQKGTKKAAVLGKSKDLTLEQDSNPAPGETPSNYVSDQSGQGFSRPIMVRMTLRHEP